MASGASSRGPVQLAPWLAHEAGLCTVVCSDSGTELITGGRDSRVKLFKILGDDESHHDPRAVLDAHKKPVTALAFSPTGTKFATGAEDHTVKLFTYPGAQFEDMVTRFTLPIRALAFSATGAYLAVGGDEYGIRIISTHDLSVVAVYKEDTKSRRGHDGAVLSLAFDPLNSYLASTDADGTIIFWDINEHKAVKTLRGVAPLADKNSAVRNRVAWHPEGTVLAVPGLNHDIVLYDRDTAEVEITMQGGHTATVTAVAWCPNGRYLATGGADRQVVLWEVDLKEQAGRDLDRELLDGTPCDLVWRAKANSLAVVDMLGHLCLWDGLVPSFMASPTERLVPGPAIDREELLRFDEDDVAAAGEEGGEASPRGAAPGGRGGDGSDRDEGVSSEGSSEGASEGVRDAKRARNGRANSDRAALGDNPRRGRRRERKRDGVSASRAPEGSLMQASFQSGATRAVPGKRRFLAYNLLGCVTTREEDGFAHIEVEFHDTGSGHRVPAKTDYFGFTMAALGEGGCMFGNPAKGEQHPSTLLYCPFDSWASNSEWTMRFDAAEEVRAVAVGTGWAAAATSLNRLRLFSEAGMQTFVLGLDGPVVTMAGQEQLMAVVWHAAPPLPCGDQVMHFTIYDMAKRDKAATGPLPLTPGATLAWLGFSEAGQLCAYDSAGNVQIFWQSGFGGSWLPIFSSHAAAPEEKRGRESHWMVGLDAAQLFFIVCEAPHTEPQVTPRSALRVFAPSVPLAHSDLNALGLETKSVQKSIALIEARARLDAAAAARRPLEAEEERVFAAEQQMDHTLLRLMSAACTADKLTRAYELATAMALPTSLEGATLLASKLALPLLAERLNLLLEERMEAEAAKAAEEEEDARRSDATAAPPRHSSPQAAGPPPPTERAHDAFSPQTPTFGERGEGAATPPAERPFEFPPVPLSGMGSPGGGGEGGHVAKERRRSEAQRGERSDPLRHVERARGGASGSGDHVPPAGAGAAPPPRVEEEPLQSPCAPSFQRVASSAAAKAGHNPFLRGPREDKGGSILDSVKRMQALANEDGAGKRKLGQASSKRP